MAYDILLADRALQYINEHCDKAIEEQKMFSGLGLLVDGKMCVSISGNNLMLRYDPAIEDEVAQKPGYLPMVMRGRAMKGFCYVTPDGFQKKAEFEYWMDICLAFNPKAKSSRKKNK